MKASAHFVVLALLSACGDSADDEATRPQAVRTAEVRVGPVLQGREHLAEVVPERTIRVLAQVPGTVAELGVAEGVPVTAGAALVRVAAPDVTARIARVRSERERVERERDFACDQLGTDRVLADAGDLASVQLQRSETGCASAELAVRAAQAAEQEAAVAGTRSIERAPFDGEVLTQLVDLGQTVMPGTPLLQYGSQERRLRLRVPERDLAAVALGGRVQTAHGPGRIVEIGGQALGPGRLIEVEAELDEPLAQRVGTTLTVLLVVEERAAATAVPLTALSEDGPAAYVVVVEGDRLRRVDVELGPREDGWVAIEPALPAGSLVVSSALSTLDLAGPVFAVTP